MKSWYLIGIVMALIPIYFRNRARAGGAGPYGTQELATQRHPAERRFLWLLFFGALGFAVYAWAATPPLPLLQ